jgi:FHA domain
MAQASAFGKPRQEFGGNLKGQAIVGELIRNMELGQFELAYTVLLPCVFSVYLHPKDHAHLAGVFNLIADDARRALRQRVADLNRPPSLRWRSSKTSREFRIAARDWVIEFFPDEEVPAGDVEIHSQLNETEQPDFRGVKTTLTGREPSVTSQRRETRKSADAVFAELRYEDDTGPQLYLMTQNEVRVGRGGGDQPMDLALYASDEVSREHFALRRDPATGVFLIVDRSTNGTWLDGRRLKKGAEEMLAAHAEIKVAEVITITFEARP